MGDSRSTPNNNDNIDCAKNKQQFVSMFRIDGAPIMPPVMTKEKTKEMRAYKLKAIEIEQKLRSKQNSENDEQLKMPICSIKLGAVKKNETDLIVLSENDEFSTTTTTTESKELYTNSIGSEDLASFIDFSKRLKILQASENFGAKKLKNFASSSESLAVNGESELNTTFCANCFDHENPRKIINTNKPVNVTVLNRSFDLDSTSKYNLNWDKLQSSVKNRFNLSDATFNSPKKEVIKNGNVNVSEYEAQLNSTRTTTKTTSIEKDTLLDNKNKQKYSESLTKILEAPVITVVPPSPITTIKDSSLKKKTVQQSSSTSSTDSTKSTKKSVNLLKNNSNSIQSSSSESSTELSKSISLHSSVSKQLCATKNKEISASKEVNKTPKQRYDIKYKNISISSTTSNHIKSTGASKSSLHAVISKTILSPRSPKQQTNLNDAQLPRSSQSTINSDIESIKSFDSLSISEHLTPRSKSAASIASKRNVTSLKPLKVLEQTPPTTPSKIDKIIQPTCSNNRKLSYSNVTLRKKSPNTKSAAQGTKTPIKADIKIKVPEKSENSNSCEKSEESKNADKYEKTEKSEKSSVKNDLIADDNLKTVQTTEPTPINFEELNSQKWEESTIPKELNAKVSPKKTAIAYELDISFVESPECLKNRKSKTTNESKDKKSPQHLIRKLNNSTNSNSCAQPSNVAVTLVSPQPAIDKNSNLTNSPYLWLLNNSGKGISPLNSPIPKDNLDPATPSIIVSETSFTTPAQSSEIFAVKNGPSAMENTPNLTGESLVRSNSFTLSTPSNALLKFLDQQNSNIIDSNGNRCATKSNKYRIITTPKSKYKHKFRPSSAPAKMLHKYYPKVVCPARNCSISRSDKKRPNVTLEKSEIDSNVEQVGGMSSSNSSPSAILAEEHHQRLLNLLKKQKEEQRRMQQIFEEQQKQLLDELTAAMLSAQLGLQLTPNKTSTPDHQKSPNNFANLVITSPALSCSSSVLSASFQTACSSANSITESTASTLKSATQDTSKSSEKRTSRRLVFDLPATFTASFGIGGVASNAPSPRRSIKLSPEEEELEKQRRIEAATVLNAYVRGYLTRRLLKTEHVQRIVQTISDTLSFVIKLHLEGENSQDPAREIEELKLKARLLQQLSSASRSLCSFFSETTIKDRMEIIARDRQRNRKNGLNRKRSPKNIGRT